MESSLGRLRGYERHVACLLAGCLAGLGLMAVVEGEKIHRQETETITVRMVGAVRDIEVKVQAGSTVEDLLACVELKDGAELSEIDGFRRLGHNEIIVIPFEGKTTVYVHGAVKKPQVVVLEKEAKPKHLLECVELEDDADVSQLKRKKSLRSGSVIEIRRKKSPVSIKRKQKEQRSQ